MELLDSAAIERFWSKADRTADCWIWTAAIMHKGYGVFGITSGGRKATWRAHRLAYEMTHGTLSPNQQVDHTCHNRACINPDHLRITTPKQNQENRAGATARSTTGVRGVYWDAARNKYQACVRHNNKNVSAGRHATLAEAEAAVIAKRNELFTHNNVDRAAA